MKSPLSQQFPLTSTPTTQTHDLNNNNSLPSIKNLPIPGNFHSSNGGGPMNVNNASVGGGERRDVRNVNGHSIGSVGSLIHNEEESTTIASTSNNNANVTASTSMNTTTSETLGKSNWLKGVLNNDEKRQ